MSTIGSLAVNLYLRTEKFTRGIKGARSQMTLFGGSVKAAALVVAGYVTAMGVAFKRIEEDVTGISNTAQKLGVSTEHMVGLQHAAELSEVSTGQLASALERMATALGKAETGNKGAIEAFKAIGLSAQDLEGLSADEAFLRVAAGMNKIADSDQRLAASKGIFGKNTTILNLIKEGPEAIRAFMKEAEDFGLTFSAKQAAEMDAAGDAIDRITASIKGLGREMAIASAPSVEKWAGATVDNIKRLRGVEVEELTKRDQVWEDRLATLNDEQFRAFSKDFGHGGRGAVAAADRANLGFLAGLDAATSDQTVIQGAIARRWDRMAKERIENARPRGFKAASGGDGKMTNLQKLLLDESKKQTGKLSEIARLRGINLGAGEPMTVTASKCIHDSGSTDTSGQHARRVWAVDTDSDTQPWYSVLQQARALTGDGQVPSYGATYNYGGTLMADAFAQQFSVDYQEEKETKRRRLITVEFGPPIEQSVSQLGGDPDNPFTWGIEYWIDWVEEAVALEEAYNVDELTNANADFSTRAALTLGPVTNAAGQEFTEPVMKTVWHPILNARKIYATLEQIIALNLAYMGTTNNATFFGAAVRQAKYLMTESGRKQKKGGIEYWEGVTRIEFLPTTDVKILNNGWKEVGSDADALVMSQVQTDQNDATSLVPVSEPVNLGLDGKRLSSAAPGIFLTYRYLTGATYTSIGIGG